MASNASFDISTGADLQEVDNAVNQALKEIAQRYDFKGTHCTIEFDRPKAEIRLSADDEFRMDALLDVLQGRMIKRGVPVKNLKIGDPVQGTGQSVRRTVEPDPGHPPGRRQEDREGDQGWRLQEGAGVDPGRRDPGDQPLQGRAAGGHRDAAGQDFGIELKFGNYRG